MEHLFKTWPESASQLISVAAGRIPADTVILGGQLVNVHTREMQVIVLVIKLKFCVLKGF
jgi:adenine deaminase